MDGHGERNIFHMGVSLNGGTPKWMVYTGKPYQNGWFGDTTISEAPTNKRIKLKQHPCIWANGFHDLSWPHFKCGLVREILKPNKEIFLKMTPSKNWLQKRGVVNY